jgi:hypothetical protein
MDELFAGGDEVEKCNGSCKFMEVPPHTTPGWIYHIGDADVLVHSLQPK